MATPPSLPATKPRSHCHHRRSACCHPPEILLPSQPCRASPPRAHDRRPEFFQRFHHGRPTIALPIKLCNAEACARAGLHCAIVLLLSSPAIFLRAAFFPISTVSCRRSGTLKFLLPRSAEPSLCSCSPPHHHGRHAVFLPCRHCVELHPCLHRWPQTPFSINGHCTPSSSPKPPSTARLEFRHYRCWPKNSQADQPDKPSSPPLVTIAQHPIHSLHRSPASFSAFL